MEDPEVIDAFLESGSTAAFGPSLHVERGTLKLDGWWSLAYRVSDRTVLLRDEPAPTGSPAPDDMAAALAARGLVAIGSDLPAVVMLTYTNLDLGYAPWVVWSTDPATGEADLNAKATEETFLGGEGPSDAPTEFDGTAQARGARRLAGEATAVVLTVGVADGAVASLRDGLADCRVEDRDFAGIEPEDCGALLPTLVVVDATRPAGVAFVVALHSSQAVTGPVVAVTAGGEMCAGADATLAASGTPEEWLALLRDLLH